MPAAMIDVVFNGLREEVAGDNRIAARDGD